MKTFTTYIATRNPVWVAPLALPIVLFGSQSIERAVAFAIIVAVTIPAVHLISFFAEAWLPRMLRIVPVLIIAAGVVTIVEAFALRAGVVQSDRFLLMLRATSVSGLVIAPTVRARPGERFIDRMQIVLGLTVGFVVGFAAFTAIRVGIVAAGYGIGQSVAAGFLILAAGKMVTTRRSAS